MKRTILTAVLGFLAGYVCRVQASWLGAQEVHINTPLSRIAVQAFNGGTYVGPRLFPIVPVAKQSDAYYVINKSTWLRAPVNTRRSPKTSPRRVEFDISTDQYFAHNYALAGENAFEALANADDPIALRERTTRYTVDQLMRDLELRIANKVTSISNIGSGVVLAGSQKWSDYTGSSPFSDVTTGHAFIRQNTGVVPNTGLMDWDTYQVLRKHPELLDMYKYTQGGLLNDAELKEVFKIQNLIVSDAVYNPAQEGVASSAANIWGNNFLLCYVGVPDLQTISFGLGFRWTPEGVPAPMQTRVYDDPDPGKKVELVEVGYYQDEKIVAPQLAYLVGSTM